MKNAFKQLHELGVETVAEVDRRLLSGDSPGSVAKWLQEDLQVFSKLKPASLKKNLERYRSLDLKDKVIHQVAQEATKVSAVKLVAKVNALDEMERLVLTQLGRYQKIVGHEGTLPQGILLKQAQDEGRLLKEMISELGKLQLEVGVLARAPKKVSGVTTDLTTGEQHTFQWTEEQEKLLLELERLPDVIDVPDEEIEDA